MLEVRSGVCLVPPHAGAVTGPVRSLLALGACLLAALLVGAATAAARPAGATLRTDQTSAG